MKAIWSGSLSFGLVNIPVKLYSAVNPRPVSFKLIHEKDNSPIEYRRWCAEGKHEVPWNEVVKGVNLGEGSFYVFSKRELAALRPKRSEVIEVHEFVSSDLIGPILVDGNYYLGPEKAGQKAFFLLREVLIKEGRAAIGSFVMRDREYLCAIQPYGPGMLLTTLNYDEEMRSIEEVEGLSEAPSLKKEELELAKDLVKKLSKPRLDISRFHDTYVTSIKALLKKREEGHVVQVKEEVPQATSEANLLDALKASLED
ncbi:MAG: Ku protein [Methanomassiliicoccales archaeon]|nr:Ku protein [Methanomassiliicoccales archaeon]